MGEYDWNAKDYIEHSAPQQAWGAELIKKLDLTGNENILDLGCGDGRNAARLAGMVPHGSVRGIDSSETMIALAQERFPSFRFKNLSFEVCDASALPFVSQFDWVYSNAVLHWIKDHRPVLKGIFQCLKPGGRILLQMGGKGNAQILTDLCNQLIQETHWREFFQDFSMPYYFYTAEEYTLWLQAAGFENNHVELIAKTMTHQNTAALAAWMKPVWMAYLARLPENQHDEFIDELSRLYVKETAQHQQSPIEVGMMRLQVEALKNRKSHERA